MDNARQFSVGDHVKWRSQASGVWREKHGEVVYAVRMGCKRPSNSYLEGRFDAETSNLDGAYSRDHESYIIKVQGIPKKNKPDQMTRARLYFPRVSALLMEDESFKENGNDC